MTPAEQTVLDLLAAHPSARLRVNPDGAVEVGPLDLTKETVRALHRFGSLVLYREQIASAYVLPEQRRSQ